MDDTWYVKSQLVVCTPIPGSTPAGKFSKPPVESVADRVTYLAYLHCSLQYADFADREHVPKAPPTC